MAKAVQRRSDVVKEEQARCKHPALFVREAPMRCGNSVRYASPPFRVCTKCGWAEEAIGLAGGYVKMKYRGESIPTLRWEEANAFVRGGGGSRIWYVGDADANRNLWLNQKTL